jgi:hypothetical protein
VRKIDTIVIHQSDSAFGNAAVIDKWHRERGWSGIGYHWVILNGRIDAGAAGAARAAGAAKAANGTATPCSGAAKAANGTATPCSGAAKAANDVRPECDGMIQAGRPPERVGAHVRGHNATSLGICLIGKGEGLPIGSAAVPAASGAGETPALPGAHGYITHAQWRALVGLCRELMKRFGVPVERVLGHREFPGVAKTCPGFEVAELRRALGGKD